MIALRRGAIEVIHEDYMDGNHITNVVTLLLTPLSNRCIRSSSQEEEKLDLLCMMYCTVSLCKIMTDNRVLL